jgi:beta-lactamase regulating signal transducer with metallopeptidase domain
MLIHSIWEDSVIWILLQMAIIVLQKKSAQARYLAACFALAVMALLPWMTFGSMDLYARLHSAPAGSVSTPIQSDEVSSPTSATVSPGLALSPSPTGSSGTFILPVPQKSFVDAILPWVVCGWILGVGVFSFRLWISWLSVRRLARMALPQLSAAWQQCFRELCQTAGVRSVVRLGESAAVVVPLVVGWLKPVILLPLGVLAQLPSERVEAILLHELAHIRRNDFLVNLLQSVVETLFFYHPAVRSISRRIREERERVCDDLSVEWCRNPVAYAEALTTFEEFRRQSLALAVTGEGDLLARVRRIVLGVEPRQRTASLFAVAGFLATGVYLASMFLTPLLAAKLMTDQQRIESLTASRIQEEGPVETRVFGGLKTEDRQPIPADLRAFSFSGGANFTSSGTFFFEGNPFSESVRGQFFSLSVLAAGYAPLFIDTKLVGKEVGPLALILRRGMPARIRLVTPDGAPLAGVSLNGVFAKIGPFASIKIPEMRTDANGEAVVKHVEADTLLALSAEKLGWQYAEKTLGNWKPDQVAIWQLMPATPVLGTVIDKETRQPVPDAEIRLASRTRGDPVLVPDGYRPLTETTTTTYNAYDIPPPPMLAHTDSQGRFRLDTLNDDDICWVYVSAPDHTMTSLPVKNGDSDLKVELDRGLSLKGRILDPDGILRTLNQPLMIRADLMIQTNEHLRTGYRVAVPVTQRGPELTFSFTGLPKGKTKLQVSYGPSCDLNLQKDMDDFVMDLSAAAQKKTTQPIRTVQILLDPGPGHAPAFGQIHVESLSELSTVVNGQVTLSVPTPGDVTVNPDGLIGYWFLRQDFKVPSGDQPFLKTIPLFPAGAIRGKITADPSVRDQAFSCIAVVVNRPKPLEYGGGGVMALMGDGAALIPQNTYLTASLPFGGTYAVLLCPNSGANFAASPPFTIDAEHPIIDYDMRRVAGQTLRGRFLDENNQPIGLAHIALVYWPPTTLGWNQSADVGMTARDGTFAIPQVNLDVPGYYEVQLYAPKWAQNSVHIDRHTPQPLTLIARHQ